METIKRAWTNPIECKNKYDENLNPTGGRVDGVGIHINWQEGPRPNDETPNGAFVEDAILAAVQRLEFFQGSKFACHENGEAINHLNAALGFLQSRHDDRVQRGVQGKHEA